MVNYKLQITTKFLFMGFEILCIKLGFNKKGLMTDTECKKRV